MRTIRLGPAIGLAVDAQTQRVFVICTSCHPNGVGTVTTLDARSGALVRTVTVGPSPLALAVDERTSRVFVADDRGVTMLDAGTGRIVRTLPLAGGANHIALAASLGHVFVNGAIIQGQPTAVTLLDARSGALVRTTRVSGGATVMAVAERAGRVVVTSFDAAYVPGKVTGTLRLLDARTGAVVRTVGLGPEPYVVAVDEAHGRLFIAEGDATTGGTAEMRDARSGALLHSAPIHSDPATAAVDTLTQRVFVTTLYGTDILDARSGVLLHSVPTPTLSRPLVLAPTGRVVMLLPSPVDEQGRLTGPAYAVVLDGRTGAVQRRLNIGAIRDGWAGSYDALAVDARSGRGFVLTGDGVAMFDATRL